MPRRNGDDETVHVQGHLSARLGLECGRCLEPFSFPVEQNLDLTVVESTPIELEDALG